MANWNAYQWTPEQDAAIRQAYEQVQRGSNKRLALQWSISPRAISARAAQLGLAPLIASGIRNKMPRWLNEEISIVRSHSGEPTTQIRARLYAKGYHRSLPAIRRLIARLREAGSAPEREEFYEIRNCLTTQSISIGMGVSNTMIDSWVRRGLLKTKQTGEKNFRVVHYRDLRRFLIDYVGCWDHRKADRWFLVDVLTNQNAESVGKCEVIGKIRNE